MFLSRFKFPCLSIHTFNISDQYDHQVVKLCEELYNSGSLPDWPGLHTLPRTPPHSSSSPFSPRPWDMHSGDMSGSDRGTYTASTATVTGPISAQSTESGGGATGSAGVGGGTSIAGSNNYNQSAVPSRCVYLLRKTFRLCSEMAYLSSPVMT